MSEVTPNTLHSGNRDTRDNEIFNRSYRLAIAVLSNKSEQDALDFLTYDPPAERTGIEDIEMRGDAATAREEEYLRSADLFDMSKEPY